MGVNSTKEARAEYQREYRRKNKERVQGHEIKTRFGISLDDYNKMMEDQQGVCKICGLPESKLDHRSKLPRRLAVDHCHSTGKVRGLLCSDCNTALGLMKDNPKLLNEAIKYLSGA